MYPFIGKSKYTNFFVIFKFFYFFHNQITFISTIYISWCFRIISCEKYSANGTTNHIDRFAMLVISNRSGNAILSVTQSAAWRLSCKKYFAVWRQCSQNLWFWFSSIFIQNWWLSHKNWGKYSYALLVGVWEKMWNFRLIYLICKNNNFFLSACIAIQVACTWIDKRSSI